MKLLPRRAHIVAVTIWTCRAPGNDPESLAHTGMHRTSAGGQIRAVLPKRGTVVQDIEAAGEDSRGDRGEDGGRGIQTGSGLRTFRLRSLRWRPCRRIQVLRGRFVDPVALWFSHPLPGCKKPNHSTELYLCTA